MATLVNGYGLSTDPTAIRNRTFFTENVMPYSFGEKYFFCMRHCNIENDEKRFFDRFFRSIFQKKLIWGKSDITFCIKGGGVSFTVVIIQTAYVPACIRHLD